jgi:hypothetical protein
MAVVELDNGLKQVGVGATNVRGRCDRAGAMVVAQGSADLAEMVLSGRVMTAVNAVAGATPGTALATTAPISLWNPPGSGKNLVILHASIGYVSGTLGAGCWAFAQAPQATTPAGTELTPVNNLLGFPRGVGRAFTGATAIGAVPTIIRPSFSTGPMLATSVFAPFEIVDDVKGGIVITPGNAMVLSFIGGAGTSPLVIHCIKYAEVDA